MEQQPTVPTPPGRPKPPPAPQETPQSLALSSLGAERHSSGTWRLLTFALFIFSIMMVAFLGLKYGYGSFVQSQIDQVELELDRLAQSALPEEREQFVKFFFQIVNLKEVIDDHVIASKILPFLERSTNRDVSYASIQVDTQIGQISLSGLARNFQVLAQQLKAFERAPEIFSVATQGATAGEGGLVSFQVELSVLPTLFE
ncbi:MAG: hypothetical protein COU08_03785 [Candidatus Harrisonbacteria bacterium CG10_big_fil_rev_8_21_14_0_10_42_17]|uniref:PilN domain-containing protein n=1 Tax=Candidatus Harrisonbacteria bacterium CG10_big_fil_rev_8_21_14_0_10_42_17 TaxID=1974584 RepID=A0A2M6WHB3_9BACT|nr:MAG: hypothetical protein COU08_03785 [Candidatus Harrisonbacteria bacterium CG10_big_fil_rev_8_21_14_0_10_42_17]